MGAITLTPVQPVPDHVALVRQHVVSDLAVDLAATVNPFQAVVDAVKTTTANATTLAKVWASDPFPVAKVLANNWGIYAKEIFGGGLAGFGPGFAAFADQIGANLTKALKLPFDPGSTTTFKFCDPNPCQGKPTDKLVSTMTLPLTVIGDAPFYTSDSTVGTDGYGTSPAQVNLLLLQIAAGLTLESGTLTPPPPTGLYAPEAPGGINTLYKYFTQFAPVLTWSQTLSSGLVMGALGPVLAPVASLINSFTSFGANLKAGKYLDAVYDIVNIPTNMTSAVFNGAFLDLTAVVEKLTGSAALGSVGLNLGGLLNITPTDGPPATTYNGGVLFNQLGGPPGGEGFIVNNAGQGIPTGLGGSLVGFNQSLASVLKVTPPVAQAKAASTVPAAAAAASAPDVPAAAPVDQTPAVPATPAVPTIPAITEAASAPDAASLAADLGKIEDAPAAPARRGAGRSGSVGVGSGPDAGGVSGGHRGGRAAV
ncbi:MAG: hypothetical protein FGM52_08340 [Mycobacterium sp.]|nr:hypothetical protein [Mycobacterium sp.]